MRSPSWRARALFARHAGRFTAVLAFITIASASLAQVSGLPAEEFRWHRSISAGPYSSVNTATGTLITSIPLFKLKGPGGTVLDFTLNHTSGDNNTLTNGQIAKRWRHTYDEWTVPKVVGATEVQRNSPSGGLDWWY